MSRRPCERFGDTLSGFVDGVLPDADRERVLTHLVDCPGCRAEVAELRAVRDLLGSRRPLENDAPADLSRRLVSIAGEEAADPLWSRPFTAPGRRHAYALPSRRRRMRTSVLGAVLTVGFLTVGASGVGYLAAPPAPTAIKDPGTGAEAEFSTALAQAPLSSDAVNAVIMDSGATVTARSRSAVPTPDSTSGARVPATAELDEAQSIALLDKADRASRTLAHDGIQQVSLWQDDRETTARVRVEARPGQGSQVAVLDDHGDAHREGFIARTPQPTESTRLLADRYVLSGAEGGEVAGRAATMVQATEGDRVRARWWLDSDTGLMLWSETYDEAGRTLQSSGYVSVDISASDDAFLTHLAPRLSVSRATSALSSGRIQELAGNGWGCTDSVAGLPLVQVRGDSLGDPGVLRSTYSDGVHTLSVLQRRGTLGAPAGFGWDSDLSAYVGSEVPAVATWQSGDTVVTVVTDASSRLLARAVAELPHDAPSGQGNAHRIVSGWEHILRSMAQIR